MRTRGNDLSLVFANTARNKIMTLLTTKQLTVRFQVQEPRLQMTPGYVSLNRHVSSEKGIGSRYTFSIVNLREDTNE